MTDENKAALKAAWQSIEKAIEEDDMAGLIMGLLHVQARLFQALEVADVLPPDLGAALLEADLDRPEHMRERLGARAILEALRALLAMTRRPLN